MNTRKAPHGICELIARWHWLEGDMAYIQAIEKETDRPVTRHLKEQRDIEVRLTKLIPENLWQAMHLLEFATETAEQGGCDGMEIKMLRNAREGVRRVWARTECEAERIGFLAA